MQGKILKGVGGFYYVHVGRENSSREDAGTVYECRARGIFRKKGKKPLPGDDVDITVLDEEEAQGSLDRILPRKNELIRPAAANVDQALLVFAAASPAPHYNLLDRFLVNMARQQLPVIICFNKIDLVGQELLDQMAEIYRDSGSEVLFISVRQDRGIDLVRDRLRGKTTVLAGPSGVGKSSLTNRLQPAACMEVGEISRKIERGKQTTRHTEVIWLEKDTYFLDTPGFSSLYFQDLEREELRDTYPEFRPYEGNCRFLGCMHINEPDCAVKAAVAQGRISRCRYDNYLLFEEELRNQKKY